MGQALLWKRTSFLCYKVGKELPQIGTGNLVQGGEIVIQSRATLLKSGADIAKLHSRTVQLRDTRTNGNLCILKRPFVIWEWSCIIC